MNQLIREPINTYTHLAGAILSVLGLVAMVTKSVSAGASGLQISALIVFGISMILLYSASTTYHMVKASERVIAFLRRMDHSMIFVLIAGTYTPFCLISLNGVTGWVLFSIVAFIAVCGVVFKMVWFNCPRWLSTALYIAMGWIIIFASTPLSAAISPKGMLLLIAGGVIYTIGGVIYAIKPKFMSFRNWGFHEIFHIYILLGSLAHFLCVYLYVI
ncbi:PAQR family membrane homeostasis protein TrhA [Peribacillus sp. SCS-155]|uniref:PAQR family membrane homeostasis protein TrhA n=1 Tax=Peribacillus sedimenti TaxID=3115297 RepID=UPI0039060FD6